MVLKNAWPYAVTVVAALLLALTEGDLLWTAQEQNLFLSTPLFFEQQMVRAGGLLMWTCCYLTQLFYYPLLGTVVLGVLWMVLMWLTKRAFGLTALWPTLVPVACLLSTVTMLGYWVYYLKLPGALFDATVGTIVAVAMAWAYRSLPATWWLRSAFIVVAACVGYPLFGFYALFGVALMALADWRRAAVAVVIIVAVPLECYYALYHETNIVNVYWAALPVFSFQGTRCWGCYVPYILLVGSIGGMVLWRCYSTANSHERRHNHGSYSLMRWALLGACAAGVAIAWMKDGNFHRELSMRRSIDGLDWQQVLTTAQKAKEPTRAMCMMQNLALWRMGRTGNEMFQYPNGAARPDAPFPVRNVHTIGKVLYLHYGVVNYCYRWCMEDGVEYGWTVERLKLMAQCSLLNGEFVAAQKYLNLLKKTMFHRTWAKHYEQLVSRPQLLNRDEALGPILPLLRADDFLTADQSQLEMFLVEQIMSTPGMTRQQQELANFTMRYYRRNRYQIIER